MSVVFLLDLRRRLEKVYMSSRSSGVLRFVLQSYIDSRLIAFLSFRLFQWFRLIIQNRPHEDDDDLRGLDDISDVRNGFFATRTLHPAFDARRLVILKVCANL